MGILINKVFPKARETKKNISKVQTKANGGYVTICVSFLRHVKRLMIEMANCPKILKKRRTDK